MIIGYSESFPRRHPQAGEPTYFRLRILSGYKRHTLRQWNAAKYARWKNAELIHHAVRTRTAQYEAFRVQKNPKNVQRVRLRSRIDHLIEVFVVDDDGKERKLTEEQLQAFIRNDGFANEAEFVEWFAYDVSRGMNEFVLIHFYPNFRY